MVVAVAAEARTAMSRSESCILSALVKVQIEMRVRFEESVRC